MSFPEYKKLDLVAVNREILSGWKEKDTFRTSMKLREGAPAFVFFEGIETSTVKPSNMDETKWRCKGRIEVRGLNLEI